MSANFRCSLLKAVSFSNSPIPITPLSGVLSSCDIFARNAVFKWSLSSAFSFEFNNTHFTLDQEERLEIGIKDELVRYAMGIEDAADLIADLEQAIEA